VARDADALQVRPVVRAAVPERDDVVDVERDGDLVVAQRALEVLVVHDPEARLGREPLPLHFFFSAEAGKKKKTFYFLE
jgi:hypothetical protein